MSDTASNGSDANPLNVEQAPAALAASVRENILGYDDVQEDTVTVPEWGGVVLLVRGMSGEERADMFNRAMDSEGNLAFDAMYPEIIISCSFHPDYPEERVFNPGDRLALNKKSGAALERVARVAMRLSGMDREGRDEAGKDSASTPSDGSTSTSPGTSE